MSDWFSGRISHGRVWRIAGPMMLSNLTVPLVGAVDTAVVGHLDEPYHMGAVALGAAIFGIVFWGFGFLRMGTTGISAQAFGKNDHSQLRATLARALLIAGVIALVLIVFQTPVAWLAFHLVQGTALVEQHGRVYFDIRIWSAPATLMNYVLLGWFLGMQNARVPLLIVTFINLINMLLDGWFVMGLGYGAAGVALASLMAEYLGLGLALLMAAKALKDYPAPSGRIRVFDKAKVNAMLSINRDIFIRNLCLMFTLAFFTAQGARFGDTVLAANAILFNMQTFMAYTLDGFAHAAEALVGKAIGARNRQALVETVKVAGGWALAASIVIALSYYLAGYWLITLMSDIAQVRQTALVYLPWLVFLPLVSVWAFLMDGVYVGATRGREMRNTMLLATLLFLAFWYALLPLGNHGLWLAFTLFMTIRAVSMLLMLKPVLRRGGLSG